MGFLKKITKNPLRTAAAIGTLGGSEAAIAIGKKLGLKTGGEEGAYQTPEQAQQAKFSEFANNYSGEMGLADKGVQESGLTKGLFGEGGLQSRLGAEEQKLASQGFQLTQDDHSAYGQASGDVARMFGQQEQDASQSLARRGLASGASGASGAMYSGLAGNKNEMLAKAQTNIAQNRMANTTQRLQQMRGQMQSLGMQGAGLAQGRYNSKGDSLKSSVNVESMGNDQKRQAMADKEAAYKPGMFETIGNGLQTGVGQLATQAPGMALGKATGGMYGTANNQQIQDQKQQARRDIG